MNTVTVNASGSYEILIGEDLLSQLGPRIRAMGSVQKIALVSDSHVWPLWGKTVTDILEASGFSVFSFVFPEGEAHKCAATYLELQNRLALEQMTRSDLMVALGGGVVGDLCGFAAATYLRGVPFIQLPTTLLAAVDSSVGGKTAIDLPAGKNLVGAFYQPRLVVCDLRCLTTLEEDIFRDGCAEVIKYGILYDPELFSHLEANGLQFDRKWVITRCVELKRNVVEQDEFDRGSRMLLNLGHTLGHGVEAASHFTVSHGRAVAIGTAMVTRSARALGLCSEETLRRVLALLQKFGLPTEADLSPEALVHYALSDKKRSGDRVTLIVPRDIGLCEPLPTPVADLHTFIKAGITYGSDHLSR